MKDRSIRRHQDLKAKIKNKRTYISCINNLSVSEKQDIENNIEKLRKICVLSQLDDTNKKEQKKPLREIKHDITMKEQLRLAL